MNKNNVIFWLTTGLVAFMMLFSAFGYFTNADMKDAFVHLGFPSYFRVELGIFKVLGALVLLLPMVPSRIKEFAYFGFALTFVSAFVAHTTMGDPMSVAIVPLVMLVFLSVSYVYFHKRAQEAA